MEYHGPHYDLPALRMEPSPTAPDPHHRRRPLGPGAAPGRRAVRRLGGGRRLHAGGGPPAIWVNSTRPCTAPGAGDEPFAIYLSLWANPDVDTYRSFEEDYGVTDMLCAPAMVAEVDPSDSPEAQLQTRIDASARYAEDVMEKMR